MCESGGGRPTDAQELVRVRGSSALVGVGLLHGEHVVLTNLPPLPCEHGEVSPHLFLGLEKL